MEGIVVGRSEFWLLQTHRIVSETEPALHRLNGIRFRAVASVERFRLAVQRQQELQVAVAGPPLSIADPPIPAGPVNKMYRKYPALVSWGV